MKPDMKRRKLLQCMAAGATLPNAFVLGACKDGKGESKPEQPDLAAQSSKATKSSVDWEKKSAGLDLVDRLNTASLRHRGVFIDFGTTDYAKYTLGKWKTGWGRNYAKKGISFTQAKGSTGRVFFPWFDNVDAVLKIRLLPHKATLVSVYMNNKPVSKIDFKSKDWNTYTLNIPKSMLQSGENYLLLRWQGGAQLAADDDAVWVDYIYMAEERGGSGEVSPLPTQNSIAGKATLDGGGEPVPALALYPGFTLSYYLQVPEAALEPTLGFYLRPEKTQATAAAGQSAPSPLRLTVNAAGDKGLAVNLLDESISPESTVNFEPRSIGLKDMGDQIVRLDVSLEGGDGSSPGPFKLVLARPAVYVSGKNFTKPPQIIRGKNRKVARNAILIMIDTLRADHTHCYGGNIKTPVMDRLAEEGTLFERFSAVEDWTKPSCATMLTGLYPNTHKAQTENIVLSKSVRMVSEELKGHGFKTGAFIANGYVSGKFGFKRGWDYYENYIREKKVTEAENVFAKSAAWIEQNKNNRFFAYVHTIDPHVPYSPPDDFLKLYDKKPYDGPINPRMSHLQLEDIKKGKLKVNERDKKRIEALYKGEISYHDKYLGGFLQKMADLGIIEDTLLIITSDHGEEFWEHGSVGHGHSIFQELVHVPFIAFWKGTMPEGRKILENHDHTVIVPTMLDAMALDIPDYLEGVSVLPKIFGQDNTFPHAGFSTHQGDRMGVWSDNYKLQMNGPINTFLYDMKKNPECKDNLEKKRPTTLRYMRTLLGMFSGAPDKRSWKSARLLSEKSLDVEVEEVEWDDELKKQLKILGYVNE